MSKQRTLEEVEAEVEENERRLKSCPHHEFQRPNNGSLYNFVYICHNCGGRVDQTAKTYYQMRYDPDKKNNKASIYINKGLDKNKEGNT